MDTPIVGSPATMATYLASLGWVPGEQVSALTPGIEGLTPVQAKTILGQNVWFTRIVSAEALILPEGIEVADEQLAALTTGVIAGLPAPRTLTKVEIYNRMADAELETLNALLQQVTLRQRMSWMDATVIEVDREDVQSLAIAAFGSERASEILG